MTKPKTIQEVIALGVLVRDRAIIAAAHRVGATVYFVSDIEGDEVGPYLLREDYNKLTNDAK